MKKEPLENGIELLTRFAGMECESPDYCPLIQKIITYTAKHGDEKAGGEKLEEAVRRVFSQAFVNCLYGYASSLKDSLMSTLKQLAAWLTPAQKITVSGVSLRVGEAMKEAEALSGLKCLKKLQYAKTGTDEQEKIVRDVIHYAREHDEKAKIPGMNIRDLAEKALLGVYAENANQFQQDIAPLMEGDQPDITLDCTDMEYTSSQGLRMFLMLQKSVNARNGKMVMKNMKPQVKEVFDITGFSNIIKIL